MRAFYNRDSRCRELPRQTRHRRNTTAGTVKELLSVAFHALRPALIASIIIPRNDNGVANDLRCLRAAVRLPV